MKYKDKNGISLYYNGKDTTSVLVKEVISEAVSATAGGCCPM